VRSRDLGSFIKLNVQADKLSSFWIDDINLDFNHKLLVHIDESFLIVLLYHSVESVHRFRVDVCLDDDVKNLSEHLFNCPDISISLNLYVQNHSIHTNDFLPESNYRWR
jgi:hypothetical protein